MRNKSSRIIWFIINYEDKIEFSKFSENYFLRVNVVQSVVSFEKKKNNNNVEIEIVAQKPLKIATYSNLCKSLLILMPKPARTAPLPKFGNFLFFFKLAENHVRCS